MRKLTLSDEILMTVEKPARYIGGEVNAVMKELDERIRVRFAMCFPDVYEIGLTRGRTSGASGCIPRGRTWTVSCANGISRCLRWNLRTP